VRHRLALKIEGLTGLFRRLRVVPIVETWLPPRSGMTVSSFRLSIPDWFSFLSGQLQIRRTFIPPQSFPSSQANNAGKSQNKKINHSTNMIQVLGLKSRDESRSFAQTSSEDYRHSLRLNLDPTVVSE
jgi:hypothetical protein